VNFKKITYEKINDVIRIGFGKFEEKTLTTLCELTLKELESALSQVEKDDEAKGLIFFSHKENCFLAGVDISIIKGLSSAAQASDGASKGQELFNRVEDLKIPTMSVVDGFCLGGGLELSLACDKIIASDSSSTKLGLPEVMLGVLPGFGGCYRLPKAVGLPTALDMILSGKQLRAKKALKEGLVSAIMPKERLEENFEKELFKKKKERGGFGAFLSDNYLSQKVIFQQARKNVMKKTKGLYPSPLRILDLLETYGDKKRDVFLEQEAKTFGDLSQTKQSKNLVHIFFLQDNAKKLHKDATRSIEQAAVLGAGTMGGGIAWFFSKNNVPSYMKDISSEALSLGLKQASMNFSSALKKRRMSQDDFKRKMALITPTLSYDGFKSTDLIVEAIVENMDIKKKVLSELESHVSAKTIITSNTSSLSLNEMSSSLKNKKRFAGLHFFNPVHKMPLVEIIKHDEISDDTVATLYQFIIDSKKTPVIVKDGPGFLVNRILATYLNEAAFLLEEGYKVEDIDELALEFGLPMGPCHLMDEVGLDVSHKVADVLFKGLGDRFTPSAISETALENGLLGKKNNKGFYLYDSKGKKGEVNPEVTSFLKQDKDVVNREELKLRMILPMVNEASYCIDEKIVESPEDLDLAMIFGIGFPPFRGGVLKYADQYGIREITERIKEFSQRISAKRFSLSPGLEKMSKGEKKFY